ncbi:MAG TPA: molybdopterin-dependent oxidoreductase [Alphaproteobacteria bacterium]
MLIKKSSTDPGRTRLSGVLAGAAPSTLDRRAFLKASGLAAGGLAAAGALTPGMVQRAEAAPSAGPDVVRRKNICTHCSVGCTVTAEVENGVWVGQEPTWDSPINLGAHCAKGAAIRELTHGDRRLKYPMKLVDGKWQRITWDQAINEIGDKMLEIRQKSGPESVYWLGSAKFSNEGGYLFRKMSAFWGTNNIDHQARICHSTTVAGVANTWGYGAMTNSYNDIRNSKCITIMGGNPAEAHPVSLQHVLEGKEKNRAPLIVIDPRFTRTAAHADEYVRIRPGTDIPTVYGLLWHIFENGWEDKEYIRQRVYGMDDIRKEVAKWPPDEVERVTGVPGAQLKRVAETMAKNRPGTLIWCMGVTQHSMGTANVRALSILQLALGNIGIEGGGANIFRGHDNVQGCTDLGLDVTTLPAYYGLVEGAWKHWCRVWEVDYDWMQSRFESKKMMETKGIPSTRWFDAVTMDKKDIEQTDIVRAMVFWGHAGNSVQRLPEQKKGMEKVDLLVVIDPHPTTTAALPDRKNGTYLLPACSQLETRGSRVASNRSLQWGDQIVKPIFESKPDHEIIYLFAKKFGFEKEMFKNIKVDGNEPDIEDTLREINRGCVSIGYTGQSPERLKLHMANQGDFDVVTLRAIKGPAKGDFYGLPWPCWGTPEMKHPGSHVLYNTSLPVKDGGGAFRARFGVEREGVSLLADGSYPTGSEIKDGHPEFTYGLLKKMGWDKDLTQAERATIEKIGGNNPDAVSWAVDLSMGIIRVCMDHGVQAMGNAKARANAFGLPDPIPVHREPIYTVRRDLVEKYPALTDRRDYRLPYLGKSIQDKDLSKDFPIILTSGRLVEYEGGGEETRSNKWLAELQQNMFIEISTDDAARLGIKDGQDVWVYGPENNAKAKVRALVTPRMGKGVAFMPFHFSGIYQGADQRSNYPTGADPIVLGEAATGVTTYGYDAVTHMHEGKATICRIQAA